MGCNICFRTPCACVVPAQPLPFYIQAPTAAQDHTRNVYIQQYGFGLTIPNSWVIPALGGSIAVQVANVFVIPTGAVIWSEGYGYYTVQSFDFEKQLLTITNTSEPEKIGQVVPACTTFTVSPPPCCDETDASGTYVKLDFTAPEVDTCLDITLTSLEGLIVGNNVGIGTGVYRLSEVKSGNVVNICNDGEGLIPGTPVIAQNIAGQYQYPVITISVSACSQDPVESGSLIVCSEGNQRVLTGGVNGAVPVVIDSATGEVEFSNDIPNDIANIEAALVPCTLANSLSSAFVIVAGNQFDEGASLSPPDLDGTNPSLIALGPILYTTISNTSSCRNMVIHFSQELLFDGELNGVAGSDGVVSYYFYSGTAVGTISSPPANPTPISEQRWDRYQSTNGSDGGDYPSNVDDTYTRVQSFVLSAGQQIKIGTRVAMSFERYTGATLNGLEGNIKTSWIGVAL